MQNNTAIILPHRGLGDLMWHLPVIKHIGRTNTSGKTFLITKQSTQAHAFFKNNNNIDDVIYMRFEKHPLKKWLFILKLRRLFVKHAISTVYILDKVSRPAMAAKLAGVKHIIGFGQGAQKSWLTQGVIPNIPKNLHRISQLKQFAQNLNMNLSNDDSSIHLPRLEKLPTVLQQAPKPWICLGIGAAVSNKIWSEKYFAKIIDTLPQPATILLMGSQAEKPIAKNIMVLTKSKNNIVDCTQNSIIENTHIISLSTIFIGNDSGPMNVAAMLGIKSIVLFGPTEILKYSSNIIPVTSSTEDINDITPDAVLKEVYEHFVY